MAAPAASFEVRGGSTAGIVSATLRACGQVRSPSCLLLFSSGTHVKHMVAVARQLHEQQPNVPTVLLSGAGALTERGELESQDATTGVVWSGGKTLLVDAAEAELESTGLTRLVASPPGYSPQLVFLRSESFRPELLTTSAVGQPKLPPMFGAGTHGDPGLVCSDSRGVRKAAAVIVHLRGLTPPRVQTTHSCRLLSPPIPITRAEGAMVFELGGEAALSVLERLGAKLSGRPLLFTVLSHDEDGQTEGNWLVRGIQGIDPARRALLISSDVRPGMRMTFAIKDARAARDDLDRRCRRVTQELHGAVPRFGLYFNCSARGTNLHTRGDVDTRVLKERFPDLPIAGFCSAFEIAPFNDSPVFQIYTGVIALFTSPS